MTSPANGDFFDRIDELLAAVGTGEITAQNVTDQIYARYQHEGEGFEHPRGGQAHYARDPLFSEMDRRWEEVGRKAVTETGSELKEAMIDLAEAQSDDVLEHAPREYGDLETSGHPSVIDNGATVYDRPPKTKRLSEDDLRLKHLGRDHREGRRGRFRARAPRKLPKR